MANSLDTLRSIFALARAGADADTKDFMREHLLAIAELAREALHKSSSTNASVETNLAPRESTRNRRI